MLKFGFNAEGLGLSSWAWRARHESSDPRARMRASALRGKVAEGVDFDRHFGRCVVLFGIPFQYALSRVLKARLDFLRVCVVLGLDV